MKAGFWSFFQCKFLAASRASLFCFVFFFPRSGRSQFTSALGSSGKRHSLYHLVLWLQCKAKRVLAPGLSEGGIRSKEIVRLFCCNKVRSRKAFVQQTGMNQCVFPPPSCKKGAGNGRVPPEQTLRERASTRGRGRNRPLARTHFLSLQPRADPNSAPRLFILSQSWPQPISRCNQRFLVPSPTPGLPIGLEPDAIIISACNEKLQI